MTILHKKPLPFVVVFYFRCPNEQQNLVLTSQPIHHTNPPDQYTKCDYAL